MAISDYKQPSLEQQLKAMTNIMAGMLRQVPGSVMKFPKDDCTTGPTEEVQVMFDEATEEFTIWLGPNDVTLPSSDS